MGAPAWFDALAARAAQAEPQAGAATAKVEGRVLLIDGDALAYACAGNDECDPGQARRNLLNTLEEAERACGARAKRILLTALTSHKGHRYAVATVKPYQGQRASGRRPKNWAYLRGLLDGHFNQIPTYTALEAEADDLFGAFGSELGWENVVHFTQDKDMRMLPGWHLTWKDKRLHWVGSEWVSVFDDKVYGRKWFWLQMLHGDTADYVPGLPKYVTPKGTQALCGEVTAGKLLAECTSEDGARQVVLGLYRGFYGDDAELHMLEQGILLWMRRDAKSSLLNVTAPGHPLHWLADHPAINTILRRTVA
jgi:DNA polymerase-1